MFLGAVDTVVHNLTPEISHGENVYQITVSNFIQKDDHFADLFVLTELLESIQILFQHLGE